MRNRGEVGWQIDLQTVLYETDTKSLNASKFIMIRRALDVGESYAALMNLNLMNFATINEEN